MRWLAVSLLSIGAAGQSLADIKITNDQVPKFAGPIKRMKLSRADIRNDFVNKVLANVAPGARFESLSQSKFAAKHGLRASSNIQAAIDGDRVAAVIDAAKGSVDVSPALERLAPMVKSVDLKSMGAVPDNSKSKASSVAAGALTEGGFGNDATKAVLEEMITLYGSEVTGEGTKAKVNAAKTGPLLASFPVKRMVGNLPVFGVGSRGMISVDGSGKIQGFTKHWQVASDHDQVTETRDQGQIVELIKEQLGELSAKGSVVVQDVELGYYDGDEGYMQPVYQFKAKFTATPPAGESVVADDDYVAGYIPIGETLEPIPSMLDKSGTPPGVPQGAPAPSSVSEFSPSEPPSAMMAAFGPVGRQAEDPVADPLVGRYVVRNDYVGWVNSANRFWGGIAASGYSAYFTNSQYYWAYPYLFTTSKNSFVNNVQVALVEGHGDWYIFTTRSNCCDVVTNDSIPYPGYGSSAGGKLSYFIIHSCEVVPAAVDIATWGAKWWKIFGGLHTVLGYRTIMYIDDGVMYPFGRLAGLGYGVASSWLTTVANASMYSGSPGAVMHGSWKRYGRPSVITVCGHSGDTIYNNTPLPRASCFNNYWY